jgi:plastocyanin
MRRPILPALAIAATLALAACASGSTTAPSQAASAAPSAAQSSGSASGGSGGAGGSQSVEIKNFAFNPATLNVKVGDKVTWTNADSAAHTVTFDDGSADSKNIANGATFDHTFSTAGTFAYHCSIHTSMKGTITVGS